MIQKMKYVVFTCLFLSSSLNATLGVTKERMHAEIDFLSEMVQTSYAPLDWKKQQYGENIPNLESFHGTIRNYPNARLPIQECWNLIRGFFSGFKDHHMHPYFYSTESAELPLCLYNIDGKYYITYINRDLLPQQDYPFNPGDEIVLFDGEPIEEYVQRFDLKRGNLSHKTTTSLAAHFLTDRKGSRGDRVPSGAITIAVRQNGSNDLINYELEWLYTPDRLKRTVVYAQKESSPLVEAFKGIFGAKVLMPLFSPGTIGVQGKPLTLGGYSYVPSLGEILWESPDDCPFFAYIFQLKDGQKIGYLRIPHYDFSGCEILEVFGQLVDLFDNHTSALVIDQVNNPGGSLMHLYAFASMLTEKPLAVPRHRVAITQQKIMWALSLLSVFESQEEFAKQLIELLVPEMAFLGQELVVDFSNYLRILIGQWDQGSFITDPLHLNGIETLKPHPKHRYTKPILMLINELDFSGGDFLPAILQDNGRALLLGERTAGAGGAVQTVSYPNALGICAYNITYTIAERVNGNPIEDLGVEPEVPYSLTKRDLKCDYTDYKEKILTSVRKLCLEALESHGSGSFAR